MTERPKALRPSDYDDGPPDLSHLFPFVGGTLAEQRRVIRKRKADWEVEDAANERDRVVAFHAAQAERGRDHDAATEARRG